MSNAVPDHAIRQLLRRGVVMIALLIVVFGGWGTFASISGAVVAPGTVAAQMKTNVVQHPDGGVVAEILSKEGDPVAEGQTLLRLDETDIDDELTGIKAELAAKTRQVELLTDELVDLNKLLKKGLVPRTRVVAAERELASLSGEVGHLTAQKARANARLKRLEIKSPVTGKILELNVHTIGGVIAAGKDVLQIVPAGDTFAIEARVATKDVDQVHVGQAVAVRLSALNQRTTPRLWGHISVISPDIVQDVTTGAHYYAARVALNDGEPRKLPDTELVPGMPVEVLIMTSARSPLSYFAKPLLDQIARAFREE